jgi:hypothetical protein
MINPTTQSEELLFSTVRIETVDDAEKLRVGTGFLFNFDIAEKQHIPVVITNKHVVKNAVEGRYHLHYSENLDGVVRPSNKSFTARFENFEDFWIPHPDADVDLCAMFFNPVVEQAAQQGKKPYFRSLDKRFVKSDLELEELNAAEEIVMVGYPNGLWDEVNNLPLMRRGITASHPAIDFGGKSIGVIDIAAFPGSSGSPVVILNQGAYLNKLHGPAVGSRTILLGVLFGGPLINLEGRIEIREIPTSVEPIIVTSAMIHLGYIIKAKEILVLGQHIVENLKAEGKL